MQETYIQYLMTRPCKDSDEKGRDDLSCGCGPGNGCRVEAVLSIDERGQMVLPKDVREKAGIRSGDKLALISWERDGEVCCLALIRAEGLSSMVRDLIGPVIQPQG